ncbi:uncharacterized protein LOC143465449 isoform X2 [Clavelina lepadiformis]|uniref:uncharacterized protein LOC143465449 isoform X2 n=1 Tax=Clavelina lepadiformis TaxID=159417 RepID=UPI004042DDBD
MACYIIKNNCRSYLHFCANKWLGKAKNYQETKVGLKSCTIRLINGTFLDGGFRCYFDDEAAAVIFDVDDDIFVERKTDILMKTIRQQNPDSQGHQSDKNW